MIKRYIKNPTVIIIIALASIIYISMYSLNHNKIAAANNTIDNFTKSLSYHTYNQNNQLSSIIQSTLSLYDKTTQTFRFTKPNVILYSTQTESWQITADQGTSNEDYSHIFFSGHVVAIKKTIEPDGKPSNDMTITTKTATYDNKTDLITTKDYVTIQQGDSILHGTGMIANLTTGQYKLLSSSQGHYVPE